MLINQAVLFHELGYDYDPNRKDVSNARSPLLERISGGRGRTLSGPYGRSISQTDINRGSTYHQLFGLSKLRPLVASRGINIDLLRKKSKSQVSLSNLEIHVCY